MEHTGSTQLVKVVIPDAKTEKCIVLDMSGTVWAAKQLILDKVYRELPEGRDALNYSLYLPASGTGKLGKFLDDTLRLSDYALHGNLPRVEMRYKSRDYRKQAAPTEKAIAKANSKANQRRLVEYVTSSSHKRIDKLLDSGLDPNFLMEDGNTPLGVACGRGRSVQCIQALLSGGAHIDFRGKDGLTPLHRAAIGGNALAINSLLSYGASPNYRDAKGLTPVYHTAIMGDDLGACITLLRHRAEIGVKDQGGWSELHHTSKYGHIQHAELFIRYGADINDQNLVGNTPLHVAASHGQNEYALMLLKRGADKKKTNFSGQTPGQVAILCGHHQLATEINEFPPDRIEPIKLAPEYNENARKFTPKLYTKSSDTCPVKPSTEIMVDILTRERDKIKEQERSAPQLFRVKASIDSNGPGRPGSASSQKSSHSHKAPADTDSISSYDMGSIHSDSTGAPGTPDPSTPTIRKMSFTSLRERLYRAGPGKYVAVQDVEPQQPGDIALRRGVSVEVTFIGKGGYWEGKAGGAEGWFPRLAIKEMGEEQYEFNTESASQFIPTSTSAPKAKSAPGKSSIREVIIRRGNRSYGFAMRGVRAATTMQFQPTPEVPALQYVGSVEENGAAAEAGLIAGDFIIEVEGVNVTYSTHDDVVKIVRKAGDTLRMKVITPLVKPKSVSQQFKKQITPVSTPESTRKDPPPSIQEESPPTKHRPILDRETVIGDTTLDRTDSPTVGNFEPTGWDSSQDDDSAVQRDNSNLLKRTPFSVTSYSRTPPLRPPLADLRSQTLPVIPVRDYPRLEDYAQADDSSTDEGEENGESLSAFEKALQDRKKEMNRMSNTSIRQRSNTIPEKDSPLMVRKTAAEGGKQSMTQQILEASKARKERVDSNQPRMSPRSSPVPLRDNPIARALSSKIKVRAPTVEDSDNTDSETEGSYSPVLVQSKLKKVPPPTTRPKPSRKTPSSPNWKGDLKAHSKSPLLSSKYVHTKDSLSPPPDAEVALPRPISAGDSLDFDLPPPVLDVAPPVGFSVDKVGNSEDLTDDFIPPPLPQSSPPPAKSGGDAEMFIFPDSSPPPTSPDKISSSKRIPNSQSIDALPSPIPSPTAFSQNLLDLSSSVVPPPEFVSVSPKSPESDEVLPPLPSDPPPPLDLDEGSADQTDDYSGGMAAETNVEVLVTGTSNNLAQMDTPPPHPPPPMDAPSPSPTPKVTKDTAAIDNSVAPETTPKPVTAFSQKEPQSPANEHPSVTPAEVKVQTTRSQDTKASHTSKPVAEWEVEEVCEWLREIGLSEYAEAFEENEITGEVLKDLGKDDLKDLGIKKIGHQKKLRLKIAALST